MQEANNSRRFTVHPQVYRLAFRCLLPTAFCLLPSAFCLLPTDFCLLPSAFHRQVRLPAVRCLLLSAFCLLPSVFCFAQPGVPHPSSPLYGGGPTTGSTSLGLPPVLKKVGIDQKLHEQLPLDAVFKDEQGREVRL